MGQFSTLILFLLAVAFLLRIDFIFYIIYICVGVYAWSRWYTPRAMQSLFASRQFEDHAFWGEAVPITIRLNNRNRLPLPWLQLVESTALELAAGKAVDQVLSLPGKDEIAISYSVTARRRGYYKLGPLRITTGDLFGLTDEQERILPPDYLTIYPRIVPVTRLGLPSRLPYGTIASRQRLFEDPARPIGVRDFRSGDTIRQINWKVSAHMRNLVVKTLEPAISLETAILLNLHNGDYRRRNRAMYTEWAIEVAASLAAHLTSQRQAVGLITNGVDPLTRTDSATPAFDDATGRLLAGEETTQGTARPIPPRPGRAHLMRILEGLARVESGDTVSFQEWTPRACLHLAWGVTILAITAAGNEAICQTLHRLVRSGYNPVLIVIEPDYNFGRVRERARRLGFVAYSVIERRELSAGIGRVDGIP